MKKVTVKDIALRSGYSIATVSKTLNGTDRISAETVEKIKKIAAEMGYRSSFSAQSLARKTRKIAIVMFRDPIEVRSLFEEGFNESFGLYGEFGIEPAYYLYDQANEPEWKEICEESDAVIVVPCSGVERFGEGLDAFGEKKPLVTLQTRFPRRLENELCEVTVNARVAGAMAAQFLSICIPGGKAAVITGYGGAWIHRENILGFRAAAENFQIDCMGVAECFDRMDKAYEETRKLLKTHSSLNGIFVTSYVSSAVCQCVREMERDVRVIGVDLFGGSAACLREGSLSAALFQNQKKQAQLALEAVVNSFRGIETEPVIRVKPELVLESNLSCYGWK